MMAIAGYRPRTIEEGPPSKNASDCVCYHASTDGIDATTSNPICRDCATGGDA